ncbi:MAG: hypothetical protein WA110_02675, partial [Anaerolineaceae bacterium]
PTHRSAPVAGMNGATRMASTSSVSSLKFEPTKRLTPSINSLPYRSWADCSWFMTTPPLVPVSPKAAMVLSAPKHDMLAGIPALLPTHPPLKTRPKQLPSPPGMPP